MLQCRLQNGEGAKVKLETTVGGEFRCWRRGKFVTHSSLPACSIHGARFCSELHKSNPVNFSSAKDTGKSKIQTLLTNVSKSLQMHLEKSAHTFHLLSLDGVNGK